MVLLSLLIAIGCLQFWSAKNPLHNDAWALASMRFLLGRSHRYKGFALLMAIALPTAVAALLALALHDFWLLSLVYSSILLFYSLGRGEFTELLLDYLEASRVGRLDRAIELAQSLGADLSATDTADWAALHQEVFVNVAYRALERMFAVVFWFCFFGSAGALMYRLSVLFSGQALSEERSDNARLKGLLDRWLWALEWPVARLMALSFAITGNFIECVERLSGMVFCHQKSTRFVLAAAVAGALSMSAESASDDTSGRDIEALKGLLNRTLWLWLAFVALLSFL